MNQNYLIETNNSINAAITRRSEEALARTIARIKASIKQ
jgi:hypothetical protein